ncbi:PEP/pyruvate-binding domain-containing protein [Streptosporangium sp. NPDC048865]|uniref:PEP/pyruvate-binding domain-containing protein n=1 Tax=Streptosporangium sp. NPDC048865 TaxID=3155766 RepID=UPI003444C40D
MIVPLTEATADTCGGKAGALGALLRAGLPVPDGFVLPFAAYLAATGDPDPARLATTRDPDPARLATTRDPGAGRPAGEPDDPGTARRTIEARPLHATVTGALGRALDELGDPPVAVRSSAADEDTAQASAAGRYESFLAVRGVTEVTGAVRACWASLFSPRAAAYRRTHGRGGPAMAVIVQRHLDAEVSGVMFTPGAPDGTTRIEASWGLGPSVVGGTVTPDAYIVTGNGRVTRTLADKRTRLDRHGTRLVTADVPDGDRDRPAIDDATAARLAGLGGRIAAVLGGPQDVEWSIAGGRVWILQARPVTAALPPPTSAAATGTATVLTGTPGSRGTATGTARIVRGPGDFARVHPGDILVCPFTDPAWTPLLRVAAGVVTETGGVLSHAAIVAREHAIPAVLGVPNATGRLHDDTVLTVDGTTGTVTTADP